MPIRTWLVATALIATVVVATLVLAPITYIMIDLINSTGPDTGEGRTALNSAMNMSYRVFPWTIVVIVGGLLIWAYTRPQYRESESYAY